MKRDLNLMRQIMLDLEECEEAYIDICTLYQNNDSITDFTKIAYHVRLLENAGYIETDTPTMMGGYVNYPIKLITNDGYEFLSGLLNYKVHGKRLCLSWKSLVKSLQ